MKRSKSDLINELLKTLRLKHPIYCSEIGNYLNKTKNIENALYKWSYYELLGYYQKWKEGFYSFDMIIYILTGLEI